MVRVNRKEALVENKNTLKKFAHYLNGYSSHHRCKMIGNFTIVMNFYTKGSPESFQVSLFTNVDTLRESSRQLYNADCAGHTVQKYMNSVESFIDISKGNTYPAYVRGLFKYECK